MKSIVVTVKQYQSWIPMPYVIHELERINQEMVLTIVTTDSTYWPGRDEINPIRYENYISFMVTSST